MGLIEGWPLTIAWSAYDIIHIASWWLISHSAPKAKASKSFKL